MPEKKITKKALARELENIMAKGICVDAPRLQKDMCSQFADYREWIREAVTNEADAGATRVKVSGTQKDELIRIRVEGNGQGMDEDGGLNYCTLFRSVKHGDPGKMVGTHGIGKLSILAIPGYHSMQMVTSTGTECWRISAGDLLEGAPITLERIEPVPPHGTRLDVWFAKRDPLEEELRQLGDILEKYLSYFPIRIEIENAAPGWSDPDFIPPGRIIQGNWAAPAGWLSRRYVITPDNKEFDVILHLGREQHRVYQNYVFVTSRHDLLFHDREESFHIPNLCIRVNSSHFELPFGRHRISNDDVLRLLTWHIRNTILPDYFHYIAKAYLRGFQGEGQTFFSEVEEMALFLMYYDSSPDKPWSQLPLFSLQDDGEVSLRHLQQLAKQNGKLYLEKSENLHLDYSIFDAPVLSSHQPSCGIKVLQHLFGDTLIPIGQGDVVMEPPVKAGLELGEKELRLQRHLVFHAPGSWHGTEEGRGGGNATMVSDSENNVSIRHASSYSLTNMEKSVKALAELTDLTWRVNYLVEGDGMTPCRTRRFIQKKNEVILNLHFPEIQRLVSLSAESDAAAVLAGHWALAICLAEDGKSILPQYDPETIEELLHVDAMVKCTESPASPAGSLPDYGEYLGGNGLLSDTGQNSLRPLLRSLEELDRIVKKLDEGESNG